MANSLKHLEEQLHRPNLSVQQLKYIFRELASLKTKTPPKCRDLWRKYKQLYRFACKKDQELVLQNRIQNILTTSGALLQEKESPKNRIQTKELVRKIQECYRNYGLSPENHYSLNRAKDNLAQLCNPGRTRSTRSRIIPFAPIHDSHAESFRDNCEHALSLCQLAHSLYTNNYPNSLERFIQLPTHLQTRLTYHCLSLKTGQGAECIIRNMKAEDNERERTLLMQAAHGLAHELTHGHVYYPSREELTMTCKDVAELS